MEVKFEVEQADDVQRAERLQIGRDQGEFWSTHSIRELAAERGVEPVNDANALRDSILSGQDVDDFLEAIGSESR